MTTTHAHRNTRHATGEPLAVARYNAAFEELGLEWRLEAPVYARHVDIADEEARICACIETQYPHLLKVYDRDFLANVVTEAGALQRLHDKGGPQPH
jgi:hypothetical protein